MQGVLEIDFPAERVRVEFIQFGGDLQFRPQGECRLPHLREGGDDRVGAGVGHLLRRFSVVGVGTGDIGGDVARDAQAVRQTVVCNGVVRERHAGNRQGFNREGCREGFGRVPLAREGRCNGVSTGEGGTGRGISVVSISTGDTLGEFSRDGKRLLRSVIRDGTVGERHAGDFFRCGRVRVGFVGGIVRGFGGILAGIPAAPCTCVGTRGVRRPCRSIAARNKNKGDEK